MLPVELFLSSFSVIVVGCLIGQVIIYFINKKQQR